MDGFIQNAVESMKKIVIKLIILFVQIVIKLKNIINDLIVCFFRLFNLYTNKFKL